MSKRLDWPALVVGIGLIALAAVIWWDALRLPAAGAYGIGPEAMPKIVALFLVGLGVGHLVAALRSGLPLPEAADWRAIGLIGAALAALMLSIGLGGGFVPGMACLFALTARAFGRRALAVDLGFGAALGLGVYLMFSKLLSLSLPQGPIERLFG